LSFSRSENKGRGEGGLFIFWRGELGVLFGGGLRKEVREEMREGRGSEGILELV